MRMRKKKNLDKKMQTVAEYLTVCVYDDLNYDTSVEKHEYFDLHEFFGNDNPVEIEVGCGKGTFACETAKRNPDVNILAVELNPNVIYMACCMAKEQNIKNAHFVQSRAEYLPKYIHDGSVKRIYLNFSCPYPKNKYESHRLTSDRFLGIYRRLMTSDGEIYQKTDNMHFFEYSIEKYTENGYCLKNITLDLHASDFEGNIVTEYEQRFLDLGQPIYRLEAYTKGAK